MSTKETTVSAVKQFVAENKAFMDFCQRIKESNILCAKESSLTRSEFVAVQQYRNFYLAVKFKLNGEQNTDIVFNKSINVTKATDKQNKHNKVLDVLKMADIATQADNIIKDLIAQGYEAYALLTDGGQILKVYKKEKPQETVAKLKDMLDLLKLQYDSINSELAQKLELFEDKQKAISTLQKQAEALGIKVSFA